MKLLEKKTKAEAWSAAPRGLAQLVSVRPTEPSRVAGTPGPSRPELPEVDRDSGPRPTEPDGPGILVRLLRSMGELLHRRGDLVIPLRPEGGPLEGAFRRSRLHDAMRRGALQRRLAYLGPQPPTRNEAA